MKICHIALGGCLTASPIPFGLTEDTGGHIAYVLGAATAQARHKSVSEVTIVTRGFCEPALGADFAKPLQRLGPHLSIRRLMTGHRGYLGKEDLAAEVPALTRAFLDLLERMPEPPDVIHAHFSDAAVLGRAAERRFGIPLVFTPHSLGIDKRRHLDCAGDPALEARIAQERSALRAARAVIVSSRDEAERQVGAYGVEAEGRTHRLWPGVDAPGTGERCTARARALLGETLTRPDRPMILAIARPVRRKNLQRLAEIYARSGRLRARANLVILAGQFDTGAGGNAECHAVQSALRALAEREDLRGRMALPSRHSRADVQSLYALAAQGRGVFANIACHEPFGLTLLEAGVHGLPVVATQAGGPPDILAETGHGVTVSPRDDAEIEAALFDLLTDAPRWQRHSQSAGRTLPALNWTRWAARSLEIYDALCRPRAPLPVAAPYILGCDIDNTLTGSERAARSFGAWASRTDALFAVATGRSIVEARRVLADWSLPEPHVFVTAVGSEIHWPDARGLFRLDTAYAAQISHGWEPQRVRDVIAAAGIRFQPGIEQRRWKLAAFGTPEDAGRLRRALGRAGLPAQVFASHGHLIDILPARAGKGEALLALGARLGLGREQIIGAGDSGNDVSLLSRCGRGIVVGNASDGIAGLARAPALYCAKASYADGVLEGLEAFGLRRRVEVRP